MTGWFPALRLARSPSTRPRHWPVFAVLRPRSRGSHNSVSDTRLVPSCVTTIGSTTSTDHANRARTAPRDSIVTQYRIRFAGMTKCRIANMQLTTFHGPRCDPRIALCSFPPTGRLTVTNCRFAAVYRHLPRKMIVRNCALALDLRQTSFQFPNTANHGNHRGRDPLRHRAAPNRQAEGHVSGGRRERVQPVQ